MGSWSGWINTRDQLVNQFGGGKHPFYLSPQYQYKREGNTVYYNVRLNLNYYINSGWSGVSYSYNCGVKLQWGSASGTHDGSSDYVCNPGKNISQGWHYSHKDYGTYSITNTTGSGTVTIGAYANNQSTKGFDNPPRSGSSYGWHSFSLSIPPMETITITYNDNGGSGGPGSQTKTIGTDLTLSSTKPVKATTYGTGYTITFNDTIGTPDYSSYTTDSHTTYTFDRWNTASDGSGTSYYPGGTFTSDSATTLYAIYTSTVYSEGVPLPQSSSTTHILKGWARGSASGTIVEDNYIPTQNETLYAVWEERKAKVSVKNNNTWKAPNMKVLSGSSWITLLDMATSWPAAAFYIEGTEYVLPVPCTWGRWLQSQYNVDGYYAEKINGKWRVVIEQDTSTSAFVLSEVSWDTEADMWNTYITFEYNYEIKKIYYYNRLSFIQGTGTQYIDTGEKVTSDMTIVIDMALTNSAGDQKFCGCYDGSNGMCLGTLNGAWRYGPGMWTGNSGTAITDRVIVQVYGGTYIFGSEAFTSTAISNCTNGNIVIAGIVYQGSVIEKASMKIYGLKIYKNGVLVKDMVPCYRSSSVGMYDMVNSVFYGNAGTGTFVKGSEVDW